jgi:hypothetical protein
LLLVALAPTGAAAHGKVPHAHAAKHAGDIAAESGVARASRVVIAIPAELRAQAPLPGDHQADADCERGCCNAGHCSGCGTALAPATWACLRLPSDTVLLTPDASLPASLAREGPARPPKSFA